MAFLSKCFLGRDMNEMMEGTRQVYKEEIPSSKKRTFRGSEVGISLAFWGQQEDW